MPDTTFRRPAVLPGVLFAAFATLTGGAAVAQDVAPPLPTTEMGRMMALADPADATVRSTGSGPWSAASSWTPARVPVAGDRVHIATGHAITLDGVQDVPLRTIRLDGTLRFATDRDTLLRVDTLVSGMTSELTMGTASDPVEADHTARLVIEDHDDPDVAGDEGFERADASAIDYDPAMLGLGVLVHGRFESAGSERVHGGPLATPPMAGATVLELDFAPTGWAVGDEIVIAGTSRDALGDEKRRIAAVDLAGERVTLDAPLALDHDVVRHTKTGLELAVHVVNLERNVVIETAASGRGPTETDREYTVSTDDYDGTFTIDLFHGRGHVMFMHTTDVAVRRTRFLALGRTSKHGAIDDVTFEADGTLDHAGINPRARYPLHFHRAGFGDAGIVEGSVADDSPGWCFVNHGSRADFRRNVAHDCDGAGFVTERGDELGSLVSNVSIRNTADEGKDRVELRFQARKPIDDFGFGGHGFWLQGINVEARDNIASGAGREAFALYPLLFDGADQTRFALTDIPEAQRAAFAAPPRPDAVPAHTFSGNLAYGSNIGLMVGEHRPETASVLAGFTGWMLRMGTSFNYSDAIRFDDLTLVGNLDAPEGLGSFAHHGTSNVAMNRPHVEGFALGLQLPRAGNQSVDTFPYKHASITDAWLNNVLNLHVLQIRSHDFLHAEIVRPRFGNLAPAALAHGIAALGAIDDTDDLDIDASNVRSNGFGELAADVVAGRITGQLDYHLHYTQTAGPTVDTRHQRDGFLPRRITVTGTDGRRHRLLFEREQQAGFVPFPTDVYVAGVDYDLTRPLDPDAPNGNRNSNLPAAFLDASVGTIADTFQRAADDPRWADFARAKDRLDTPLDIDAAVDYPGFALVPGGRLLPPDYLDDARYERWPRTRNLVAMRVDDLPDFVDYLGRGPHDDAVDLAPVKIDADACGGGATACADGTADALGTALVALPPTRVRTARDGDNGAALHLDGVADAFELAAPFSLEHKAFTWQANLRPLDTSSGTVFDVGDTHSGYRVAFRDDRLVATLTSRAAPVELVSDPVTAGDWLHAALMVNPGLGQAILYVDGARAASAALPPFRTDGGATLRLGTARTASRATADRYRGFVDDLEIGPRTYTDAAAAALAAAARKPEPARAALDGDADGVPDVADATPLDDANGADADGDRLADDVDDDADVPFTDTDGDGVPDARDPFPTDAHDWHDTDGDGTGDNRDADRDGDGVPNASDAFPLDANESADADGDGVGDRADRFPDDASGSRDSDGDGVADRLDALPFAAAESLDTDGDGVGDGADLAPADPTFGREPNLLANPSLESEVTPWTLVAGDGEGGRDTGTGHASASSLKLVGASGGGTPRWLSGAVAVGADVDRLHVAGWVRTVDAEGVALRVAIDHREGGTTTRIYRRIDVDAGTADWRRYAASFDLPAGVEAIELRLQTGTTAGSTAWFDDLALHVSAPNDADGDGLDDRPDPDADGDGFRDGEDPAPLDALVGPSVDRDRDGTPDAGDNCPVYANADQRDTDGDGAGDVCDPDDDGDGHRDALDRFPLDASEHADLDADGIGDLADTDDDGDGLPDALELALGLDPRAAGDGAGDLDRDGRSNLAEHLAGSALDADDVPPALAVPPDIERPATGSVTPVDLGVATAEDARDGRLVPTPSPLGPYPSGRHEILWRAIDEAGNVAEDTQTLVLLPRAFVSGPALAVEGARLRFVVELDGDAAAYPVRLPYTIGGSADALDVAAGGAGTLVIADGRRATLDIDTLADAEIEGDDTIELVLGTPEGAVLGGNGVHVVTLREANVAPGVTLSIMQDGEPVARIRRDGGQVVVNAGIDDPNPDDDHVLDWSGSDAVVLERASVVGGTTLVIEPSALDAGTHAVLVRATDDGDGQLVGTAGTTLVVLEPDPLEPDVVPAPPPVSEPVVVPATERDGDGDRVTDDADVTPEPWLLPSVAGGVPLQGIPGQRLVLGATALAAGRAGARLEPDDLVGVAGEGVPTSPLTHDILEAAGVLDVEVHGLEAGGTARLVLPVDGAIPAGATLALHAAPSGWRTFVVAPGDVLASARGSSVACPGVDAAEHESGLANGDHCLRLDVVDGGPNDADGRADGVVRLTTALAVTALPEPRVVARPEPLPDGRRFTERGERVVLAFALRTDHVDAELDGLTLEASGSLDAAASVRAVTLYADANGNGVPEATERLASGAYLAGERRLSFRLGTPHALAVGDSAFLVTYRF